MSESLSDPSLTYHSYTRGDYTISTDPAHLNLDAIADYLMRSYWAKTRPRAIVELSLRHSLNFGLYHTGAEGGNLGKEQVGLARLVTDYATYAYLCDVYVLEEHRRHGLGKWLIDTVIHDPSLQYPRRITLATRDAHGLYAQFGFTPPAKPEVWMERAHNL
jgi:GNAT superfamily N-acetyltransferase